MNWKVPALSVLAAVSFINASAQTELPNQWLDKQMLAAKPDRTTASGVSVAAIDATAVKRVGAGTGAAPMQSKDKPQTATTLASPSLAAQK